MYEYLPIMFKISPAKLERPHLDAEMPGLFNSAEVGLFEISRNAEGLSISPRVAIVYFDTLPNRNLLKGKCKA